MRTDFDVFVAASPNDRHDEFIGTSRPLGTAAQNTEKDRWVCWAIGHAQDGATISLSSPKLDSAERQLFCSRAQ
jgi:hypothetical protein